MTSTLFVLLAIVVALAAFAHEVLKAYPTKPEAGCEAQEPEP